MEIEKESENKDNKKNYKLVNSSKKVFYFSKFSLGLNQCLKIVKFTKSLKENLLKAVIDPLKYFTKRKF